MKLQTPSAREGFVQPLPLLGTALVGGSLAAAWSFIPLPLRSEKPTVDPPLITVGEAQSKVDFPIQVPRRIPAGGKLQGARILRVVQKGRDAIIGAAKANRKPFTGYGVLILSRAGRVVVRAMQASPAEKLGLPSDRMLDLVALNDQKLPVDEKTAWSRVSADCVPRRPSR